MKVRVCQLRFLLFLFCFTFLIFLPALSFCNQANIFIYHRFGEDRYPSTNIDVALFEQHMQFLKQSGKIVMPLSELVKYLKAGRSLPGDVVVLTVDDAFDSFLERAMPVLRKYKFPVALFVNTDSVGDPGYLDWDQLRELLAENVEIGNHTATHDYLLERKNSESLSAWKSRVTDDIERAQTAFRRELGFRPDVFAYPYGEYSPELVDLVKQAGFSAALAQQSGVVSASVNIHLLPRFPMGGPFASLSSFKSKASMRPLELEVLSPASPVLADEDPPVLSVKIPGDVYSLSQLQGFVQGDNRLQIEVQDEVVTVKAEKPISGRRNKYTLTVPLKSGAGWAWFSQPWFRLKSGF